jgi:CHAT domain-containing protein/tetratricopeptide (TPR) repeat protein
MVTVTRRGLFVLLGVALLATAIYVWPRVSRWTSPAGPRGGNPTETAARTRLESVAAAEGHDSLAAAAAGAALAQALRLDGRSTEPEAWRLATGAEATTHRLLGEASPETVRAKLLVGLLESDAGRHRDAIARLESAVQAERERQASQPDLLADALDALAVALTRARSFDDAIPALEESIAIRSADDRPGRSSATQLALETLVEARQQKGDYSGARTALERLRAVAEKCPCLKLLNLEAWQLYFEGDRTGSQSTSRAALALAEQTLRSDHPEIAATLRLLASTVDDLGFIDEARQYRQRALEIARRGLGERHYELAAYLNDLGDMDLLAGALTDARLKFEEALDIARSTLWPEHEWMATIEHNLALVDAGLGDLESAAEGQQRAIALWEKTKGRDHVFVAVGLSELAAVRREQDDLPESLRLLQRARQIREKGLAPDHLDIARTAVEIASTLARMGRFAEAERDAQRALKLWDRPDTRDAPERANVLELAARFQLERGDLTQARRSFNDALAIRRRIFGTSHPLVADVQAGLARTEARLGHAAAALSNALEAEATGRQHLRLMLRNLPERQALNYAEARPKGLPVILSLAGTDVDASVALDAVVQGRFLVLDEMTARRSPVAQPAASSPLQAQLSAARQRLANLVVRGPAQDGLQAYAAIVHRARVAMDTAERALTEQNDAFRSEVGRAQAGLTEVRRALPADAVVVSYVQFDRLHPASTRGGPQPGPSFTPSYIAFVLAHGSEPVAIHLGSAESIDALVTAWRADAASPRPRTDGARIGEALRKAIWDPIATHVQTARTVFVVPDGTLNLVPLGGLPGRRAEYLIEESGAIHYLSSERDLLAPSAPTSAKGMLVLGGPTFDARTEPAASRQARAQVPSDLRSTTCERFNEVNFQPLTGTLQEAREVAKLWSSGQRGPLEMLLEGNATERTLKRSAPGHRILHLATHGFFLGADCLTGTSGNLRAVGAVVTGPALKSDVMQVRRELPPLSGLALAGANHRNQASPDGDDGILTAEEVAGLNLRNVEWAVLSACNTGVGRVHSSEGVLGLRRAFQMAGARTIIMSLWNVDDQATRTWMRALYEGRLNQRLTTAEAVHRASLDMLKARRERGLSTSPFFWSAFVAAGDWR